MNGCAILKITEKLGGKIEASLHLPDGREKLYSDSEIGSMTKERRVSPATLKILIVNYHVSLGFAFVQSVITESKMDKEVTEYRLKSPRRMCSIDF